MIILYKLYIQDLKKRIVKNNHYVINNIFQSHLIYQIQINSTKLQFISQSSKDMRKLLLNKTTSSRFSTLKSIIKNKSQQLKSYQRFNGIQFEKHLKKLIMDSKAEAYKIHQLQKMYDRVSLTAAKPIQTILKEFLSHSKQYNEEDIVQTAVSLGKAFQISMIDHGGRLDRYGYKLLQSPMFDHFIEEVKFSLTQNTFIQTKNIVRLLDALGDMNYVDIQIIKLVMLKIQNFFRLDTEGRIKYKPRAHQIEKKGYYKANLIGFDKKLLQEPKFKQNLQFYQSRRKQFLQKKNTLAEESKLINQLKAQKKSTKSSKKASQKQKNPLDKNKQPQKQQLSQFLHNIKQLANQFKKFSHGTQQMIQSLLAIRHQYRKLVTLSDGDLILRNPELNSFALQVQEKLLQLNIITFNDIKQPAVDQDQQHKRVQDIYKYFMSKQNQDNFQDLLLDHQPSEKINFNKIRQQKNSYQFMQVIQALARYSNLPYRLQGTDDRTSLININWQRYFIQQNQNSKFKENNLEVQRIFRRSFAQTYIFIRRNLSNLLLSNIQAKIKEKIKCYTALLQMGYHSQVYQQLKLTKLEINELEQLTSQELFDVVKILNNFVSIKSSTPEQTQNIFKSPIIYSFIIDRIRNIVDNSPHLLTTRQLCDTINYIYQFQSMKETKGKKKTKINQIYNRLIKILGQQVKYLQKYQKTSKYQTVQAKRILFFEQAEGQHYSGGLAQLQQFQKYKQNRGNPFITAVYQALNTQSQSIKLPFMITGVNDKNQQSAIYLADSDNSSIDGDYVSGNISAYCQRVYKMYGIKVQPIAINKLLSIQYNEDQQLTLSRQSTIKLKDPNQVVQIISQALPSSNQKFISLMRKLSVAVAQVGQSQSSHLKIHKILSGINKTLSLFAEQKQIIFIGQFYAKRAQVLVQFNLLNRDLNLLTQQQKNTLSKAISTDKQQLTLQKLVEEIKSQLSKPLASVQNKASGEKDSPLFKGKRISLNLVEQNQDNSQNINIKLQHPEQELLNISYILDNRYIQYRDWRTRIKNNANYNQIKLEQASDVTKILAMKYCPNIKQSIIVVPQTEMAVPFYPLNWQRKHYYHSQNVQQKDKLEQITQQYRQAIINQNQNKEENNINKTIINIQNFKHELKISKQPKQILQFILNLSFIDDILVRKLDQFKGKSKESSQQKQPTLIPRDSKQYFLYLEQKYDKMYLQSPYLQYIINKIQKSEELKQKINERKNNKIKLKILFQQGSLNRKQYFDTVKQLDEKLIQHMKQLKTKLLAYVDGVSILEDSSKVVQLNQQIQDLQLALRSAFYYDHKEDQDFILSNGNYDEALKIKRWRAENNLVLYRILYKKSQNTEITKKQQQFIKNWREIVKNGIQNYVIGKQFTRLQLKKIKNQDKQKLFLPYSNLIKNSPRLALTDLILELSHFFDGQLISRLQNQIYGQIFAKNLGVPSQIFATSSNKVQRHFNNQYQRAIFENKAQLNSEQIQCLIDMSKIFKTEALSDRERYYKHYRDLQQNILRMNKCRYRNPLIAEYLKHKDNQYYKNYIPSYTEQTKRKQVQKLWKQIFHKEVQQTSRSQISSKIRQLCQNMLYIKMNTPPYFGYLVLEILKHPHTDILSKQKLIAYVELFKVPIQIDSQELLKLTEQQQISMQSIMSSMKRSQKQNFSAQLLKYL